MGEVSPKVRIRVDGQAKQNREEVDSENYCNVKIDAWLNEVVAQPRPGISVRVPPLQLATHGRPGAQNLDILIHFD